MNRQHGALAKQGINVAALDLQLVEDEFTHKIVCGLVHEFLRLGILGNGAAPSMISTRSDKVRASSGSWVTMMVVS